MRAKYPGRRKKYIASKPPSEDIAGQEVVSLM